MFLSRNDNGYRSNEDNYIDSNSGNFGGNRCHFGNDHRGLDRNRISFSNSSAGNRSGVLVRNSTHSRLRQLSVAECDKSRVNMRSLVS